MRKTISSIHVVLCTVLGLGLVHRAASRDHCLLSKGTVTTKILEIEIAEQAPESAIEGPSLEDLSDQAFSPGNVPQSLSDLFCPLAAAAEEFQLDRVSRLRGSERVPSGFLPKAERCAVVSNSGVLLNYKYGREIDAADLVFRFNDAEVGGEFLPFVGERDDIRIVNGEFGKRVSSGRMEVKPGTEYVVLRALPQQMDQVVDAHMQHEEAHIVLGNTKLAGSTAGLLWRTFGAEKGMATSGFLGVGLAMTLCDEVRAYGFAETPASHRATFHYYGERRAGAADRNPQHKLAEKEKRFWQMVSLNADVNSTDVSMLPGTRKLNCSKAV
mmetsp:Transcript_44280/g.99638  ORF Transcript_44280/g.99638 Transcript_44280/m.99638 type:complete len:327 (+) Transcript_44280:74-1054(+)